MRLLKRICAVLLQGSIPCRKGCTAPGMGGGFWSLYGVSSAWSHLSSYFSHTSAFRGMHSQSPLPRDGGWLLPSLQGK